MLHLGGDFVSEREVFNHSVYLDVKPSERTWS
jgi:hypothetical protein